MQNRKIVCKSDICDIYKRRSKEEIALTIEYIDSVIEDIKELEKKFYDCNF